MPELEHRGLLRLWWEYEERNVELTEARREDGAVGSDREAARLRFVSKPSPGSWQPPGLWGGPQGALGDRFCCSPEL